MLRNAPIKRKFIFSAMIISSLAILSSCLVFLISDFNLQRVTMKNDLSNTATILGDNSTAALSFNDADAATQTLRSLTTRPHIDGAVIYDENGKVFATYHGPGASNFTAPPWQADAFVLTPAVTTIRQGIYLNGERIGSIYLQSDMVETDARINYYAIMLIIMMVVATVIAFLLSNRLQKTISEPISHLATIVQRVASERNYALRAKKFGEDEMGRLIDGFNDMLSQLQQRDQALLEAHELLEARVAARTVELANSISLLNATLDSTADGILAVDHTSAVISYNSQFIAMWGLTPEMLAGKVRVTELLATKMKDPEQYIRQVEAARRHERRKRFDVLELADGRLFERYINPQQVDGQTVGVVINYRDITERRRAEAELQQVHRQLLDSSRQAGMAEVASNVLHNVGNVLNSVNVSANLVTESMKRSKVASLGKVAELLREHTQDLAAFITDDPKGKHLPGFLTQLAEHLLGEQRAAIKELESLRGNIDHIKEIVSMQQSYSKVSGVKELINVIDLVEDTLRMNEGALQRHGVKIIREFDDVPMINTEKHKILQILVNLVRNAKYACSESACPDKRVTLRVRRSDDHIRIDVIDNGVGISAENMTRIFGHGFTTRKDGHGFGLHSGALAARELGGTLRVHSDGPERGATFSLELPLQMETAHA